MLLGDRVVDYLIPLGLLYGVGAAMYHLPMNTMVGEKGSPAVMNRFIGLKSTVIYLTKIITPVVLGAFIDMGSYTNIAYVLFALSFLELGLTFMLTPSRHRSRRPVDFIGFFRCMMRFPVIREMFAMEILRGFGVGFLNTVRYKKFNPCVILNLCQKRFNILYRKHATALMPSCLGKRSAK
jgi:hypothetical protein